MFKSLAVIFALFVATNAFIAGGIQNGAVTEEVLEIAKWSSTQLSGYTNIAGEHNVMTVRNVKTQVVAGIIYKFTLDVLIQAEDNKYFFRSCDISVLDQPWTNTRVFNEAPKCAQHPNFQ